MRGLTTALLGLAGWAMAGCATVPPPLTIAEQAQVLATLLPGAYQSSPAEGVRAGRPLHQRIVRIVAPEGYAYAFYSEMRHEGPTGPLYRQSLFLIAAESASDRVTMEVAGVDDATVAHGLLLDPSLVARGVVKRADAGGEGCQMTWRQDGSGLLGHVDPQTCLITARRGDLRRMERFTRIGPRAIEHAEFAYDQGGKLLFGGEPGRRAIWGRVPDAPPPSGMNSGLERRPGRGLLDRQREAEQRSLVAGLGGEHDADGAAAGVLREWQ